jgi:hypothetical protein
MSRSFLSVHSTKGHWKIFNKDIMEVSMINIKQCLVNIILLYTILIFALHVYEILLFLI